MPELGLSDPTLAASFPSLEVPAHFQDDRQEMAKKKKKLEVPSPRTDAERRARQCERLARVLRTLQCIMGPGRWDAEALAQELECSTRTVQRILSTLAMAGVPYRYDPELRSYRVPKNFKFPGLDGAEQNMSETPDLKRIRPVARRLLRDGELFLESMREFNDLLEE